MAFWLELREGVRSLARAWRFSLVAVACLAVGVIATTTTFGIVDALYVRPPVGVRNADSLVQLFPSFPKLGRAMPGGVVSYPTFVALRAGLRGTMDVAAFASGEGALQDRDYVRSVKTTLVSSNYFSVLRATPTLGRFFLTEEEEPGSSGVVVLDYQFWKREFGGEASVVGRSIRISSTRYIVIGVAERQFAGVDGRHSDIWLTLGAAPRHAMWAEPLVATSTFWLHEVARLDGGISIQRAEQTATRVSRELPIGDKGGGSVQSGARIRLERLRPPMLANWGTSSAALSAATQLSGVLIAAGFFALVMGCANVAMLFLLRGATRQQEVATRLAIGASRARVIRLLTIEPAILSCAAFVASAAAAPIARQLIAVIPGASGIEVLTDLRLILFAAVTGLLAAVAAGVGPAIVTSEVQMSGALRGTGATSGRKQSRLRSGLLLLQVVCAFVLLSTSVLLLRSSLMLRKVDVGMAVDEVVVVTGHVGADARSSEVKRVIAELSERLRAREDIRAVSVAEFLPFRSSLTGMAGRQPAGDEANVRFDPVDSAYFRTLGMPVLHGRAFTSSEVRNSTKVVTVNKTLARRWWPANDALGQCVYVRGDLTCRRVVGVVGDVVTGNLREPPDAILYLPSQSKPHFANLLVRTGGPASAALEGIRGALSTSAGQVVEVIPLRRLAFRQADIAQRRALPFLVYAFAALVIAAVGVVAVLSSVAEQRATEFAIRSALGARSVDLARAVIGDTGRVVVAGLVIGGGIASMAGWLFGELLAGVTGADLFSHLTSAAFILILCTIASVRPIRRVLRESIATRLRA